MATIINSTTSLVAAAAVEHYNAHHAAAVVERGAQVITAADHQHALDDGPQSAINKTNIVDSAEDNLSVTTTATSLGEIPLAEGSSKKNITPAGVKCYTIRSLRNEHSLPIAGDLIELNSTDNSTNYAGFEVIPISSTTAHVWLNLYSLDKGVLGPVEPRNPPKCTCCGPRTLWRVTGGNNYNNNYYNDCYNSNHGSNNDHKMVITSANVAAATLYPKYRFRVNGSVVVQGLRGGEGPLLYIAAVEGTFEFFLLNNAPFWYAILAALGAQLSRPSQIFTLSPIRLGQGSFAAVVPCLHWPSSRPLAVKQLTRSTVLNNTGKVDSYRTEVDILRRLYHPFIVDFQAAFEEGGSLYVVLERFDGGTVWNYIHTQGPYTEDQTRAAITRLLIALLALGAQGIVHRDIKPENVMLTDPTDPTSVKLIDFGLAAYISSSRMHMHCGSPGFVAPEVIQRRPYDSRADVFSIGVLLFVMLTGTLPFAGGQGPVDNVIARNERCVFDLTHPNFQHISNELKHFLCWTMQPDPSRRLTVRQAFMHPWIVGSIPQSDRVASLVRALNLGTWQSPQLAAIASNQSKRYHFHPVITRLPLFNEAQGTALEIVAKEFARRMSTFVSEAQPLIRAYHIAQRRQIQPISQTNFIVRKNKKRDTMKEGGQWAISTPIPGMLTSVVKHHGRQHHKSQLSTISEQDTTDDEYYDNINQPLKHKKHQGGGGESYTTPASEPAVFSSKNRLPTAKTYTTIPTDENKRLQAYEACFYKDEDYKDDDANTVSTPKQHNNGSCLATPKSAAKLSQQQGGQNNFMLRANKRFSEDNNNNNNHITTSPSSLVNITFQARDLVARGAHESSPCFSEEETPCHRSLGTVPFF